MFIGWHFCAEVSSLLYAWVLIVLKHIFAMGKTLRRWIVDNILFLVFQVM
jgi:hypothetical protein